MPPVQRAGGEEADVLERVDVRVAQREVVHRGDVPQPHEPGVGDHGERRVGEDSGPSLDPLQPSGGGAQQHLCQAENQQDRSDVEQQDVLDHVHHHQLLAEDVDRRNERRDDREQAAGEQRHPTESRGMGLIGRPCCPPPPVVDGRRDEHAKQRLRARMTRLLLEPRYGDSPQSTNALLRTRLRVRHCIHPS